MKFTITINQKQAIDLGLTNTNQAIILGLIADAHSWAEHEIIDNEVFYWTARQKITEELPLLNLKPDSVYRHLKSLADLGLICYKKNGKKDCVKLTKKGKSYYVGNKSEFDVNSEINPTKLGNKSEFNSEINPTYKNTNTIRATKDKAHTKRAVKKTTPTLEEVKDYILDKQLSVEAIKFFDYFEAGNWIDAKGNKVKNWKQKILTWNNYAGKKEEKKERLWG